MQFIACGIIPLILYYFYVKRAVSDHQAPVESADFFVLIFPGNCFEFWRFVNVLNSTAKMYNEQTLGAESYM